MEHLGFELTGDFYQEIHSHIDDRLQPYVRLLLVYIEEISTDGNGDPTARPSTPADDPAIPRPFYPVIGTPVVGEWMHAISTAFGMVILGRPGEGGGVAGVSSFEGRTGVVTQQVPENSKAVTDHINQYPVGHSVMPLSNTATGWPLTVPAYVLTERININGNEVGFQWYLRRGTHAEWKRVWNFSSSDWTSWAQLLDDSGNPPAHSHATVGAFSAYKSANQADVGTGNTHVLFNTEEYDDAGWFWTTTGRYIPQQAGRYQLNASVRLNETADNGRIALMLYKNGVRLRYLSHQHTSGSGQVMNIPGMAIAEANGTTDFFEIYIFCSMAGVDIVGGSDATYFQGYKLP